MDAELQQRRENVRQVIDERARQLGENGMHPFEVQNLRAAANQELARAVPDTEKYQAAVDLASQYVQNKSEE